MLFWTACRSGSGQDSKSGQRSYYVCQPLLKHGRRRRRDAGRGGVRRARTPYGPRSVRCSMAP